MIKFNIRPIGDTLKEELKKIIDGKTKPEGALGRLEELAIQIGLIQNTTEPVLTKPVIVVFAGDHGIVAEGVSAYPQEVTYQMVFNFLNGGAAVNVFCEQNNIGLKIIDAGVNYDFPPGTVLMPLKVRKGTRNFRYEAAMTRQETIEAINNGKKITQTVKREHSNIIGFGEMGIGNTTAASAIMAAICELAAAECVGKGAGLTDQGVRDKTKIIDQAINFFSTGTDPMMVLQTFGGYEIAQLTGAMLAAAELGMILLIDGFIVTAAFLVAYKINPAIFEYAIFCHQSNEMAHRTMLNFLGARPLLNLEMRLGEGTGAAVALPIIQSAVCFLNKMASFESAAVSNKN